MDIKQLKFLCALDETRHFGQAAARCHVTQPTLSMRLRSLEEELGLELVRRSQRFEGFTEAGERVLAWARSLLAAQEGLYAEAAACRGQLVGTLRLGVVPLASFDPMRLVQHMAGRHPELRFQLYSLSLEQVLEGLARNQFDLGVSYLDRLDRSHFEGIELAETRMGLLHHPSHFPLDAALLNWDALAGLPLGLLSAGMHFRQSIDHNFRSRGLSPIARLETDSVQQLLQAVQRGLCCAIMPLGSEVDDELRLVPIEDAHTLAALGLIIRSGQPRSALAEACFEEARTWLAPAGLIDPVDQGIGTTD
ncbi:LysR family transcriptional regulator [Pseudomonas aeruginosa]|uniref:LysR family transcriptional regulator n=1 Tax=Pseudomonas aeruginosa TaxID=287 RepID=UPI0022B6C6B5|nr:LysR family transcriptional regulator [Pseudomonas aeruginosa]MCZ7707357.1 LysR family transcriptional regulator [Pseudomonas aeruginosa]MCZ7714088.1 LysR family transcriptional regulator [Pseudomonas aeruginosa]MCZ7766239.1 LysR family transcriptional regulator [Pseudomonas aeruginosa]MCZ7772805.1 LysR family transcriptional regulator [Pseudomonas aeruginosa]MCZ7785593.1 LysR family transcriptional regulator [Pseudomonas aeruginosa]